MQHLGSDVDVICHGIDIVIRTILKRLATKVHGHSRCFLLAIIGVLRRICRHACIGNRGALDCKVDVLASRIVSLALDDHGRPLGSVDVTCVAERIIDILDKTFVIERHGRIRFYLGSRIGNARNGGDDRIAQRRHILISHCLRGCSKSRGYGSWLSLPARIECDGASAEAKIAHLLTIGEAFGTALLGRPAIKRVATTREQVAWQTIRSVAIVGNRRHGTRPTVGIELHAIRGLLVGIGNLELPTGKELHVTINRCRRRVLVTSVRRSEPAGEIIAITNHHR